VKKKRKAREMSKVTLRNSSLGTISKMRMMIAISEMIYLTIIIQIISTIEISNQEIKKCLLFVVDFVLIDRYAV
jgi:hypothetical protein